MKTGNYNRTGLLHMILFRIWYIMNSNKSSRDMINFLFKRSYPQF
jgi:hypothetical protein